MTHPDADALWQKAAEELQDEFRAEGKSLDYDVWLAPLSFISYNKPAVTAGIASAFIRDRLAAGGDARRLQRKLESVFGPGTELELKVLTAPEDSGAKKPNPAAEAGAADDAAPKPAASPPPPPPPRARHPHLREEYTFRNFVSSDKNAFAVNAALAVAKDPGRAYNPLLLYGGVGLGKTHLMQAAGNEIYRNGGGKVIYSTAESFTNEFTAAIRTAAMPAFTSKYRTADALLLDDIHFLQGKRDTQEQVYYTFEALYNTYKQLIFVCDRPISELKDMNERLVSRFERGLNVQLQLPSYETRVAILESKLKNAGKTIPQEVIHLIARNVETNIRDLESSLTTITAYSELIGQEVTLEKARELLRDTFKSPRAGNISVDDIIKAVANYFGISFSDIKSKKRTKSIAHPRHVAVYLAHKLTELSFTELGGEFGGRDHTTMMYAADQVHRIKQQDSSLDSALQELERIIKDGKTG